MSKREFSTYQDFCRAAANSGLIVAVEPSGHEGMHASDPFQPCFAVKSGDEAAPWEAYGQYQNSEDGNDGYGVLFETQDEYNAWVHSDFV